jgi:hypothetical protein
MLLFVVMNDATTRPIRGIPTMRKTLLAFVCLTLATGVVLASEGTLMKFEGDTKVVTVKEGEKENNYKITDKTKVTFIDQDGKSADGTIEAVLKVFSKDKAKGKLKFEFTADKDNNITAVTLKGKKNK